MWSEIMVIRWLIDEREKINSITRRYIIVKQGININFNYMATAGLNIDYFCELFEN